MQKKIWYSSWMILFWPVFNFVKLQSIVRQADGEAWFLSVSLFLSFKYISLVLFAWLIFCIFLLSLLPTLPIFNYLSLYILFKFFSILSVCISVCVSRLSICVYVPFFSRMLGSVSNAEVRQRSAESFLCTLKKFQNLNLNIDEIWIMNFYWYWCQCLCKMC